MSRKKRRTVRRYRPSSKALHLIDVHERISWKTWYGGLFLVAIIVAISLFAFHPLFHKNVQALFLFTKGKVSSNSLEAFPSDAAFNISVLSTDEIKQSVILISCPRCQTKYMVDEMSDATVKTVLYPSKEANALIIDHDIESLPVMILPDGMPNAPLWYGPPTISFTD